MPEGEFIGDVKGGIDISDDGTRIFASMGPFVLFLITVPINRFGFTKSGAAHITWPYQQMENIWQQLQLVRSQIQIQT